MNAPDVGRRARSLVAIMVMLLALVACSAGAERADPPETAGRASESAESGGEAPQSGDDPPAAADETPDAGADPSPDSQADEVDYSDDAGADLVAHEYPDDPEPAEESARTLCNLNQNYVRSLRAESSEGVPVVDDNLRLSVLSMSDNLLLWESMRSHHPEYEGAIDAAWLIWEYWNDALAIQESGDGADARAAMLEAEESIEELPIESNETDCTY